MKHKLLPPPTSVGLSQTLTIRSHAFYRCGRFLSVAFLLLFMFMPFSKTMGQCSTTLVTYSTCNSSYTLYAPLNANCDYWWFECDASGGNATVLNGNVSTPSLNVAPPSGSGNQTTYYMYYEVNNSTSASCFSAVITVKWDYDLAIANTSGTVGVQSYSSITYNTYQWYQVTGAGNIYITNTSTYTPTASGLYFLTATPSCGGGTRTSNTVSVCVSNTQCNTNPTSNATCAGSFYLSFTPAAGYTVDWYECDASGSSLSPIAASTNNTTVYPASSTGNQTNYYRYICNDAYCTSICTSAVITVYWDYDLEITSDLASPPNYSIQPYSSIITYSNHQWYRNNSAISSGANSPVYSPTISGSYTLMADASCSATRTSNAIIYNAPNTQCSSTPVTYATCSTAYNLSFTPASNYDVSWYECDASGNSGSLLNSTPSNTISVSPSNTTDQTFYYYYVCTDNYSYATCTSAVITVEFNGTLNIHGGSSLPTTLSANTPNIAYGNYQWYRNGYLIPNANGTTYSAALPGAYELHTTSATCGGSVSNTISFSCQLSSSTTYTNHFFPVGTYNLSGDIYIVGTLDIAAGAVVNINNANIYLDNCAKIKVSPVIHPSVITVGGRLTITNSTIASCGTWQGIEVIGDATGWTSGTFQTSSGTLTMTNTELHDAIVGIDANTYAYLYIDNCFFENNIHHIVINECEEMNGYIDNSTFSYLSIIPPSMICTSLPSYLLPSQQKHIHATYISMVRVSNNVFHCYNLNGVNTENAIQVHTIQTTTPVSSSGFGLQITDNRILGDFYYGIYITQPHFVNIDKTSGGVAEITGNFNQAIFLEGGVDGTFVEKQTITNTASIRAGAGIYINASGKMHVEECSINNVVRGLEFYNHTNASSLEMSYFENNDIDGSIYGIYAASDAFEAATSSVANGYVCPNNYNYVRQLKIYCNRIINCDYGILGMGAIADQGSAIANTSLTDWSNRFCTNFSAHACNSGSSNNYADVVWWNNGNSGDFNIYGEVISSVNRGLLAMVGTVYMDNTAITSANVGSQYTEITPQPGKTLIYTCPGNTYNINKEENLGIISKIPENKNEIELFPNPASDKLIIKQLNGFTNEKFTIQFTDLMGRQVLNIENHVLNTLIDISILSQGIYNVQILDLKAGYHTTQKVNIIR